MRWQPWQADVMLLAVAAVWGATFPVVKQATAQVPVFWFLALRFDLATVALAALRGRQVLSASWRTWAAGLWLGTMLFAGYALQTLGLGLTTSARAGFLTGLCSVLTPMVSVIWLRRPPEPQAWAGVALAAVGMALMTLEGSLMPSAGDLLVLGCAMAYAVQIVGVSRYATGQDAGTLALAQMAAAAALSHLTSFALEPWPASVPAGVWQAVLICGLLASALAFWLQAALQPHTSPTHTALVFASEPVWAAAFAWILDGEVLTLRGYLGGALIVAGMVAAEVSWPWRRPARTRQAA